MNRNQEYLELTQELEALEAPAGSLDRALARSRKGKTVARVVRPFLGLAAVFAIFVLLVNVSPTVAQACSKVPVLRDLAEALRFSPSLTEAVEHDYYQTVGQKQTQNGVTVSVDYLIVDQRTVNVVYHLEGEGTERLNLIPDMIPEARTPAAGSTNNRISNLKKACAMLNGIEIMPGETFSYNEAVGQRTEDAGFLLAGAYADGEMVEEIGGGICQVSSTLYCAAMYAQMTTVSRTNHYFAVGYLSMGYDATVSWKQPDYRFRNDRDYPVKIVAFCDGDDGVTIEFWGTNTDGTHVSPYTERTEVYDTEYPDVLIGYSVTVIRQIVDANNNIIDRLQEPTGLYHLHDQDIAWPPEKLLRDAQSAQTVIFVPTA